jgi:hypothetical protein
MRYFLGSHKMLKYITFIALSVLILSSTTGVAKAGTKRVKAIGDWSIFEAKNPRECWAATNWKRTEWFGEKVQRDEVLLMVFFRPGEGGIGQVSYQGGTKLLQGSVNISISGKNYPFEVDGEWAWPTSKRMDKPIISAIISGSEAVITSRSRNGTAFTDTFSLSGSSAAIAEAKARCGFR